MVAFIRKHPDEKKKGLDIDHQRSLLSGKRLRKEKPVPRGRGGRAGRIIED